jgi:hypothetical protein
VRRAHDGRVRGPVQRFPVGPQSGSHGHDDSASPPYDPGRWDFPSPVLTLAFLRGPTPMRGEAQALTCIHPATLVYPRTRPRFERSVISALCPSAALGPPSAQSPFAAWRCYRHAGDVEHLLVERYSHFIAPTGSCARPVALPAASASPRTPGLCRLLSAPAGHRPFPSLSLPILPCVSGPLLRLLPGCTCPLLPPGLWPSPEKHRVGATQFPRQLLQSRAT